MPSELLLARLSKAQALLHKVLVFAQHFEQLVDALAQVASFALRLEPLQGQHGLFVRCLGGKHLPQSLAAFAGQLFRYELPQREFLEFSLFHLA